MFLFVLAYVVVFRLFITAKLNFNWISNIFEMSEEITTLELGNFSLMNFRMHPTVPLQILDFFYRKTTPYMVGALLGHIESTHIDITNCFLIPFVEEEEDEEEEDDSRKNEVLIFKNPMIDSSS
jgi:hypothetical protein